MFVGVGVGRGLHRQPIVCRPYGTGLVFVFVAGVPLHFTPAYYPPSLRDLGYGTKEPQRGERMLGRRWSMAEPQPRKTTQTNPKNKNALRSAALLCVAVANA